MNACIRWHLQPFYSETEPTNPEEFAQIEGISVGVAAALAMRRLLEGGGSLDDREAFSEGIDAQGQARRVSALRFKTLNALPLANLTLEQVFVEPRLQVRKPAPLPRPDAPQSTERSEDAHQAIPTRDYWEEEQAPLYELLPLGREYTTETVRWRSFTTTVLSAKARQVLVGAPGSGKTTATKALARQLALEALQQMAHGTDLRTLTLPLWVRLSEVALDADKPIDTLLTAARVPADLLSLSGSKPQGKNPHVFLINSLLWVSW